MLVGAPPVMPHHGQAALRGGVPDQEVAPG